MAWCIFPMAGKVVIKAMQEPKDKTLGIPIFAPGDDQLQQMIVMLVWNSLFEKFLNVLRGCNLLHQHLKILPNLGIKMQIFEPTI